MVSIIRWRIWCICYCLFGLLHALYGYNIVLFRLGIYDLQLIVRIPKINLLNYTFHRNLTILTLFCCSLWWQLLLVCRFCFFIVFLDNWHPKATTSCATVCMIWIGKNYHPLYKRISFLWSQVCKDNFTIMDLLLLTWIWIFLSV